MAQQKEKVFFLELIDIISESFFELLISGYLSMYQIDKRTFTGRFSIFLGYLCLVLCSSVLILIHF